MGDKDNLIKDPIQPPLGAQNKQEINGAVTPIYQALATDDLIYCTGDVEVIFPVAAIVYKELTIGSTNGTVTTSTTDGTPIEAGSTMTTDTSETFILTFGEWRHK